MSEKRWSTISPYRSLIDEASQKNRLMDAMIGHARYTGKTLNAILAEDPASREAGLLALTEFIGSLLVYSYNSFSQERTEVGLGSGRACAHRANLTSILKEKGIELDLSDLAYYSSVSYYVAYVPADDDTYMFWYQGLKYSRVFLEECGIVLIENFHRIYPRTLRRPLDKHKNYWLIVFAFARSGRDETLKKLAMSEILQLSPERYLADQKFLVSFDITRRELTEVAAPLPATRPLSAAMVGIVEEALLRSGMDKGPGSYAEAKKAVAGVLPGTVGEWQDVRCLIDKPLECKPGPSCCRYKNFQDWADDIKQLLDLLPRKSELSDSLTAIIVDATGLGYSPTVDSIPIGFAVVDPIPLRRLVRQRISLTDEIIAQAAKSRFIYIYLKCDSGCRKVDTDRLLNVAYVGAKEITKAKLKQGLKRIIGEVLDEYGLVVARKVIEMSR